MLDATKSISRLKKNAIMSNGGRPDPAFARKTWKDQSKKEHSRRGHPKYVRGFSLWKMQCIEKQRYESEYETACPAMPLPVQIKPKTGPEIPITSPSNGNTCNLFLENAAKQAISTNKFPNPRICQRFSPFPE